MSINLLSLGEQFLGTLVVDFDSMLSYSVLQLFQGDFCSDESVQWNPGERVVNHVLRRILL